MENTPCRGTVYTVKEGDTLYLISRKFRVPLAFILKANPMIDIYNLQIRSMERLGLTMFIVLMKIDRVDGRALEPLKMDDVMKRLLRVLSSNLRKGDIITQFSPSQYALLLPTVNYDTCKMVVERIRRAFYKEQANSNIMLTYRLGPISDKNEPTM